MLESERSAHFRLMKARLTVLIIRLVQFLADMKFFWEVRVGFCFQDRYALSLSYITLEQEQSNHLADVVDLVLLGMQLSIPVRILNKNRNKVSGEADNRWCSTELKFNLKPQMLQKIIEKESGVLTFWTLTPLACWRSDGPWVSEPVWPCPLLWVSGAYILVNINNN